MPSSAGHHAGQLALVALYTWPSTEARAEFVVSPSERQRSALAPPQIFRCGVSGLSAPVRYHDPVDTDLTTRLARLAEVHRIAGDRRREANEARLCSVPGCGEVGALLPRGVRCVSHRPEHPAPGEVPASPPRPTRTYGTATTDPLGRTGPLNQYRLPTRVES